jgi:hypothetical protein
MHMKHYFHGNKQGYHTQLFFKMEQANISTDKRMAIKCIKDISVICTLCLMLKSQPHN